MRIGTLTLSQFTFLSVSLSSGNYVLDNKITLKSLFVTTLLKVSAEASSDVVPIF